VLSEEDTLPLWADYDSEMAYLVLDEDGNLSVSVGYASQRSGMPAAFAYRIRLRWLIAEAPDEVDLRALREALLPGGSLHSEITAVEAGHSIHTDISGCDRGYLTDEATEASEEIAFALSPHSSSEGEFPFVTGRTTASADHVLDDDGIALTGEETDADLEAMAEKLTSELAESNFVVADVLEWLRALRD
jgi:hypothetical protein